MAEVGTGVFSNLTSGPSIRTNRPQCPGGGIGRRAGFRCQWLHGREGSSPFLGTTFFPEIRTPVRCAKVRVLRYIWNLVAVKWPPLRPRDFRGAALALAVLIVFAVFVIGQADFVQQATNAGYGPD